MKKVTINSVMQTPQRGLFTITLDGEAVSEFSKFVKEYSGDAECGRDLDLILLALKKMIIGSGFLERYFRIEGKMSDSVYALPIETSKLRLYCLRLSDEILIAGNGGKKRTRTYEEDGALHSYVLTLQQLDKAIKLALKKGKVTIEETIIDQKQFYI